MIIATTRMQSRPEKREELFKAIRGMLEPTRVEKGCLGFHFYQDIEDDNTCLLLEEWETQEDLNKHFLTVNFRNLLTLMDLLKKPPEIKFHIISKTAGMEAIRKVIEAKRRAQSVVMAEK